ncbi:MAG: hypothetical protein H7A37_00315 [Chlamydiales bacterium]|nr:hypothetical protein [Chlamydiia bacterium]MCP5506738.1 hypothetical protein [Chlamydiales bacterium]
MQKGHSLEFSCQQCKHPITFSLFTLEQHVPLVCTKCQKQYIFDDEALHRQLAKFEALCRQIHASEEILCDTSVGVHIGGQEVKIPFKLLLTRLSTSLDLMIGDQPLSIAFRIEPAHDLSTTIN